ncbi:hypothetical protein AB6A40_004136 [Gnathostoma spinigerum]|uniref:NHR domain-containing protein n=1 Tax=Gnathostoma spinigerum TaxID=75299 RepID=A0ABD6EDS9_9BILA
MSGELYSLYLPYPSAYFDLPEGISDEGVRIANYDETTMISQGTSQCPLPQLTFHSVHGENIQLLRGGRVAKRKDSFCKGLAFSNRPIQIDENVFIRFAEVMSCWSGVLRFGVTNVDPATHNESDLPNNILLSSDNFSRFACPDLTSKAGYWAKALPERYSQQGAVLHFYVNGDGELYYGINGTIKGIFLNGINVGSPLWVIVDIYGNSSSLEFIDPGEVHIRTRTGTGRGRFSRPTSSTTNPLASSPPVSIASSTASSHSSRNDDSVTSPLPPIRYNTGLKFTPLCFHMVHGKNVMLKNGCTLAERAANEFACGYVFTSRPLSFNEKLVIQIVDVESPYTGSLAFGLTCCDPNTLRGCVLPEDSDELLERGEYWVGIKDVAAQPKITDELAFWITEKGEVYFAKNNQTPRVIIHVDNTVRLYAWFDVYGTTQSIRTLGVAKIPASQLYRLPPPLVPPPPSLHPPRAPFDFSTPRSLLDSSPQHRYSTYLSSLFDNPNEIMLRPSSLVYPSTYSESASPAVIGRRSHSASGENFCSVPLVRLRTSIEGRNMEQLDRPERSTLTPPPVPARLGYLIFSFLNKIALSNFVSFYGVQSVLRCCLILDIL